MSPVLGLMVAVPVRFVSVQVPPETPSLRVTILPEHTALLDGPLIAVGGSLSVTVVVTMQPVLNS